MLLAQFEVQLRHGPNAWDINVDSGATVQQLYQEFKGPFKLPEEVAKPVVNSVEVEWDHQVKAEDKIVFQKRTGTKG